MPTYITDGELTEDEKSELIRGNVLFTRVAALVPGLTVDEFQQSSMAPLRAATAADYSAPRTTPESEAEDTYVHAVAGHVTASRAGDTGAAEKAALRAWAARKVLWAQRDRLNGLVFPWAAPVLINTDDQTNLY